MFSIKQDLVKISLIVLIFVTFSTSLPLDNDFLLGETSDQTMEDSDDLEKPNKTQHLYVVKAVVYEIGILTDVGENDTSSEETHERVDLTFFDAHRNDSHIDFGNIPLPVQTNISGQVLTGIAPINIGAISNPSDLLSTLPLTGTIVNITHSDTAFFKLSTQNMTSNPNDLGSSLTDGLLKITQPIDKLNDV
ncbi:uncharacterized protein LOC129606414 [Condylostylus longicornis]|uniref:uncharacterized protein LOC129606414 n=1 Tax=Condylostylus longicornis TaxID=2530218 RepID=UPI00244DA45F|nr:uncharacterized protein LOC129606414 [Condylostylus longicornis]